MLRPFAFSSDSEDLSDHDSLCALCLRCFPLQPFPLGPNSSPFPLKMTLPSTRRRSTSKSAKSREKERARSPEKRGTRETESSDDENEDEEDDVFSIIHGGTEGDCQEMVHSEDEAYEPEEPITFSRQKSTELRENYEKFFSELRPVHESNTRVSLSPETHHQKAEQNTRSVARFLKKAYPDLHNPDIVMPRQPMVQTAGSMKELVVSEMARSRLRSSFPRRVVFDLDEIVAVNNISDAPQELPENNDRERLGHLDTSVDHLKFESRFESGNLRKAIQVGPTHYELIISPDINQSTDHYQWFYFEVSNNKSGVMYTFEIINCMKTGSMFSHGMQPVFYSVGEAVAGRPGWVRAGEQVCYYRNLYTNSPEKDENEKDEKRKKKDRCSFSSRFSIFFRHKADVCYIAYHFPYTYSFLQTTLTSFMSRRAPFASVRHDIIGQSIGGNSISMVTVTAEGNVEDIKKRDFVLLSARVHPGESNSSWMMHGVLDLLITSNEPSIVELRDKFIFKLIPMLNPDGVINGSHRCSLAGVDLNRVYDRPSRVLHPEIFHTKGVIQYMVDVVVKKPLCIVDFHGHSRRPNVFMFGNNPEESWRLSDRKTAPTEKAQYALLPELLEQLAPAFSFKCCRFAITKTKEPSARITLWRQFGLSHVYTMECTYSGFDFGKYQGYQIGIAEMKEMGIRLAQSMTSLKSAIEKMRSTRGKVTRRTSSIED